VTDPTTSPPPTPAPPAPSAAPPTPPPPPNGSPRWTVAPSAKQVELRDRRAEVVFTVGNVQSAPDRAVLEVIAGDGTARSWFTLEGERQRTVVNNQTTSYKVTIEAPLGTAVGSYWMQAQVYSADIAPEESSAFSDRVSFTVAQPTEAPRRPFPWWVVVAGAAAALVLVVATVLVVRKVREPELADVPAVSGKTIPEAEDLLRGAGLSPGAKRAVNRVFPAGRVVGSEPVAGTQMDRSAAVDLLVSNGKGLIDTVVGQNSLAGLIAPAGLAADGEGIVYAADYGANRVLRIDPRAPEGERAEVLVAGGPMQRARAVAPDGQGGLLIADEGGRILRYDLDSRQLSVFAGVGNVAGPFQDGGPAASAILAGPSDVQVGPTGDVYVASRGRAAIYVISDGRVRQLPDPATGIQLSDPSSMAFGPDGALYVTEPHAQHVIKRVGNNWVRVAGTGAAGTDADGLPATSSRLNNPDDLAFDAFGDLYITDWGNNRVRVVSPDGTLGTAAGREVAGFDGDSRMEAGRALLKLAGTTSSGIAIDPDGHLYISDVQNRRIRSIT
jgi:sugar lactone lactonase YvrE